MNPKENSSDRQRPPAGGKWFWIDNATVDAMATIGAKEFAIYAYLVRVAGDKTTCYPKIETIAEVTGIPERTVKRLIPKLEKTGLISKGKERKGRSSVNVYQIHDAILAPSKHVHGATVTPSDPIHGAKTGDSQCQNGHVHSATVAHKEDTGKKTHSKKTKPLTPFPPELDSEGFRKTWGEWLTYRKERKSLLTASTVEKQLAKLAKFGQQKAIQSIERSIENGWKGLFDPEEKSNGKSTNRSKLANGPGQQHDASKPLGTF